jgi:ACS family hexuronate transporter-like MFS transporter
MVSSDKSSDKSGYRWVVCALLFFATTSNYVDRQVLGILAPHLKGEFGWTEIEYGRIVSSFQIAYAIGLFFSGWIVDRVGVRISLLGAVSLWSLAAGAHGFASKVSHFALARFGLGLSEAVNFPASIKSVKEWFPPHERALAVGIFNAGSNVGALLTPLLVPIITIWFGWRTAFYSVGVVGALWVFLAWFLLRTTASGRGSCVDTQSRLSFRSQLKRVRRNPVLIAFIAAKFITDPIWWFYLYWAPKYLSVTYQLELIELGLPLVVVYIAADIGSVGGGWLSGRFIRNGATAVHARLQAMRYCALAVVGVGTLAFVSDLWIAVGLLGIATACHQAWSANLFACVSDMSSEDDVATVVGLGGTAGALGGVVMAELTGQTLTLTGSYVPLFIACACSYLVAWLLFRALLHGRSQGI